MTFMRRDLDLAQPQTPGAVEKPGIDRFRSSVPPLRDQRPASSYRAQIFAPSTTVPSGGLEIAPAGSVRWDSLAGRQEPQEADIIVMVRPAASVIVAMSTTASKPTDYWMAINGSISAMAIIVAGALGVSRYRKERPYFARANLSLGAELFSAGHADFVRVAVSAKSIGKQSLELVPSDPLRHALGCFVAVYHYRGEPANVRPGHPITAVPVFGKEQRIDADEVVEDAVMFPVGIREPDVVAYRVEFGFEALVPRTLIQKNFSSKPPDKFVWKATSFVMAVPQVGEPQSVGTTQPASFS